MTFRQDTRGQSFTYLVAGGTVILGAGLITIFDSGFDQMLDFSSSQCGTTACTDGVANVQAVWDWFPLVVAGFFFLMIIGASIYKSRRPTR